MKKFLIAAFFFTCFCTPLFAAGSQEYKQLEIILPGADDEKIAQAKREAEVIRDQVFFDLSSATNGTVGHINRAAGKVPFEVPPEFSRLLQVGMKLYDLTDGLFDIVRTKQKFPPATLEADFQKNLVFLPKRGTFLNLQPIWQGYAVDRIAAHLKSQGFLNFLVRFGSVYRTQGLNGKESWKLHLKDVQNKDLCLVALESAGVAIVQSAPKKKPFRRSKTPPALQAVIVVDKNATNAQALATTASALDLEKSQKILSRLTAEKTGAIIRDDVGKITTAGDVTAACFEKN